MNAEERCRNWNERWSVGIMVDVKMPDGSKLESTTATPAIVDGNGVAMVAVVGLSDLVAMDRVEMSLRPYRGSGKGKAAKA